MQNTRRTGKSSPSTVLRKVAGGGSNTLATLGSCPLRGAADLAARTPPMQGNSPLRRAIPAEPKRAGLPADHQRPVFLVAAIAGAHIGKAEPAEARIEHV